MRKECMKLIYFILLIFAQGVFAEAPCDVRLGQSVGIRVVEFATDHVVHSKIPIREMSVASLNEEMTNLQDMGICEERVQRKRCVLRFEKKNALNQLTLFRADQRWLSWNLNGKTSAQKFVRILQQAGYCL